MRQTVLDFLHYLQYEKRYSQKTVTAYSIDLLQFFAFIDKQFNQTPESHIKTLHIRTFVVELVDANQLPTSVRRKISAIKSYCKYLQKISVLKTNPAKGIQTPKLGDRLPKFVEQSKLENLLDGDLDFFDTNTFAGVQNKLIIDMLYSTGMRRQELINLTWQQINFEQQNVKIQGKGNKQRIVPLSKPLLDDLKQFKKEQEIDLQNIPKANYVFLTKDGKQLYPNFVYRIVHKYISLCSTVEKKSPHVLRHSFATHLSNNGAKLNDIKELMGHASLASTQVYTHNSIEQLKEIYRIAHPKA